MDIPAVEGYTDLEVIGRGGFSVVYRARQERLNRPVALKVLIADDLDDRAVKRFERECRAMGELSWHPNVVAVYDSGATSEGRLWLTMELHDGGSFADRLRREGPVPWPDAVDATIQVGGALGAAHAAGTLHRDLKPANVLIGPFGEAKLGDFGIAALGGSATTTATASFTVAHVAPEVLRGDQPDERADVYGLASTLFMLIKGEPPFAVAPGQPVAAAMMRVLDTDPPRLDGVPDDLADLVAQALAKDPDDRPQTAAAFAATLQGIQSAQGLAVTDLRLARTQSPAAPTEPVAPIRGDSEPTIHLTPPAAPAATPLAATPPPPPAPPTSSPAESAPEGSPSRKRPVIAIAAAIVAVLLIGAGAVFLLTRGGDDSGDDLEFTDTTTEDSSPEDSSVPPLDAGAAEVAAFCADVTDFEALVDTFVADQSAVDVNDLLTQGEQIADDADTLSGQTFGGDADTALSDCITRARIASHDLTVAVTGGG